MFNTIDTFHLGHPHTVAAHAIDLGPDAGLALVDCGPDRVFENVVRGLRALGRRPEEVRHLLLTHVHLDHAGGAWRWAREFGTQVYVHPLGAGHLLDPAKLVASATRIYGARMGELWGDIEPMPPALLRTVADQELLPLGSAGPAIQAIATPGHAPHHHAYWLPGPRTLFAGDVAGVTIAGGPVVPPCPPPDIDVETWRASLARLAALEPAAAYVTHYGRLADPRAALAELGPRLTAWAGWLRDRLREGRDERSLGPDFGAFVAAGLRATGLGEEQIARYQQADPAGMSIAGLARYWRKHHPEALAAR